MLRRLYKKILNLPPVMLTSLRNFRKKCISMSFHLVGRIGILVHVMLFLNMLNACGNNVWMSKLIIRVNNSSKIPSNNVLRLWRLSYVLLHV